MQGIVRHNDNRFPPSTTPMSRWLGELASTAEEPLARFNLTVDTIEQLDDHGEECDRAQHEADEDGNFPEVEAQATFIGYDGDPYFVSGCLDCVRADVAAHADPEQETTIEMEN